MICGDYWAHQPRGWLSVLACLAGFHRPAMTGRFPGGYARDAEMVERCKCGAMRLDGTGHWGLAEYRWRRVSRTESERLITRDRQVLPILRPRGDDTVRPR